MKARFSLLLIAIMSLCTASCAAGAETLRPGQITAGDAIGETFECTEEKLKGDLSPFTADWGDSQRASLEMAMKRGVAVVQMTCEGPKVLKACMVVGDYAYSGVSLKTKLVQMKDAGSASINLGGLASASLKSAFSQGRWLNLAYMIAGAETTTVSSVSPVLLKGRCKGATHFVYEAQVGAFSMETTEQGESKTAADFLIGDAKAEAESSKSTRTTDGDPDSCKDARENGVEKTEGCSALMRVDLMAIDAAPAESTGAAPADLNAPRAVECPAGFTWDGDSCQGAAAVPYKVCEALDAKGCLEQCKLGSDESCNRFAATIVNDFKEVSEKFGAGKYYTTYTEKRAALAKSIPQHLEMLETACKAEMPSACTVLGYHHALNTFNGSNAANYFGQGCILGDGYSCAKIGIETLSIMEEGAIKATPEEIRAPLLVACQRGVAIGCAAWMEEANSGMFDAEQTTHPGIEDKAARACYGGFSDYCPIAAGLYMEDESTCAEYVLWGKFSSGVEVIPEWAMDFCTLYTPLVEDNIDTARRLLSVGCDNGGEDSCGRLKHLGGDPTIKVDEIP